MFERKKIEMMSKDKKFLVNALLCTLALLIGLCFASTSANAQMENKAWGFKAQNRASIAALMRQVEDGDSSAANTQAVPYSNDVLVCGGGGGSSSATANSTCIILNNADASIELGQDAQGNQGATSTGGTQAEAQSPADQILNTLEENGTL